MADPSGAGDLRSLPPTSSGVKNSLPNLSGGWLVMLLSGLVAVVVFLYATQQRSESVSVATVSQAITAGQPIDSDSLQLVEVNVPNSQLQSLVTFEDRAEIDGWVAIAPLQPGDFLLRSLIREASAPSGQRAMSLPVPKERAVAGSIRPGDRIDVIDTTQDFVGGVVARNLEVLSVNDDSGRGLGGSSVFTITVAVSADQAVSVAKAIDKAAFSIVRSTGATQAGGGSTASVRTPDEITTGGTE